MKYQNERGNAFLGVLICIGLILFIGWYMLASPYSPLLGENKRDISDEIADGKEYVIEITEKGFAPKDLIINRFDTITFINKGVQPHWPASDLHPEHTICLGFDSLRALQINQTYGIVFEKAQTCPFHDHLNPALKGTIVVK